jgi:hypothetical protein
VRGGQVRWYRNNYVIPAMLMALIAAFAFALRLWDVDAKGLLLGILAALASLYGLAATFIAGIGVGADGVLVRRFYGRARWVSWTEVQRFGLKTGPVMGGVRYQIAVILKDGSRLTTGVWKVESAKTRSSDQLLKDLEFARLTANHRLGLSS